MYISMTYTINWIGRSCFFLYVVVVVFCSLFSADKSDMETFIAYQWNEKKKLRSEKTFDVHTITAVAADIDVCFVPSSFRFHFVCDVFILLLFFISFASSSLDFFTLLSLTFPHLYFVYFHLNHFFLIHNFADEILCIISKQAISIWI